MASMYVIGIDFGNDSSYIAVPRAGGIETIANDYSLRNTPSFVAFSDRNRVLGVAAKNQLITNMKNTIHGFKRLLGKQYDDPAVEHELKYLPFQICKDQTGNIGFKVRYLGEDQVFTVQQVTAMFFTKLKETAEVALKCEVNQCVISVPSFFDNAERQALLDAASIANLKVLRIFNETAATALTYGIYKQDLPALEEPPRNVIFVDCGHTSLQVSACSFNKGKLKILAQASDAKLGGRDIDLILSNHFSNDFLNRYKIDPQKNPRALIRLLAEVEKLKKQMSANSTKLPMNIECFMDDKDVHAEMKRVEMEELCAGLFQRVETTLIKCLEESKLQRENIYAVEIVGGSSRIPAIKSLIESVFGKTPSTTLNQDEAVARGCALQCAMLCPAILVRDFSITDIQNYPVKMVWDPALNEDGQIEVFPKNHPIPFSKILTFYRSEQFVLNAVYADTNKFIGQFVINNVKADSEGRKQKVKVKARININGIFSIVSATLSDKQDPGAEEQVEPMDTSTTVTSENSTSNIASAQQQSKEQQEEQIKQENEMEVQENGDKEEKKEKKKKPGYKNVDLNVDIQLYGSYNEKELQAYVEAEGKMVASDHQERDRVDARNALEEYIYELRGKFSSPKELGSFIPDNEREKWIRQLDELETWLYEEGDDCQRQIYSDKLNALKDIGEPVKKRKLEFEIQPSLFEDFSSVLQLTQKAIDQYKAGDEKYSHLEQSEIGKVQESTSYAWKWVEETRSKLQSCSPYQNPPVSAEQIKIEKSNFEQTVTQILSKPKPTPPPPPMQGQDAPPSEDPSKKSKQPNESPQTGNTTTNGGTLPNGDDNSNA